MGRVIDETGKVYGYLTVLARVGSKNNRTMWLCHCKCGKKVEVAGKFLRNGHTQSCGCLGTEKLIARNIERGSSVLCPGGTAVILLATFCA